MKKRLWLLAFLISISGVLAFDLGEFWRGSFIGKIGNLGFLGLENEVMLVGFTRILIAILIFTVIFALFELTNSVLGKDGNRLLSRKHIGVIAAIMAIISAVFMPDSVLLATGIGWATLVALLLIGGPVIGLAYFLWSFPGKDTEGQHLPDSRGTILIKLLISVLLFWILNAMNTHLEGLGAATKVSEAVHGSIEQFIGYAISIVTLLLLYYLVKLFVVGGKDKEQRESEWAESRKKVKKFVQEKGKKMKLDPVKGFVINGMNAIEGVATALKDGNRKSAKKLANEFDKNIRSAWREIKKLRNKSEGKERQELERIAVYAQTLSQRLDDDVIKKLKDKEWKNKVQDIVAKIGSYRASCGKIIDDLDTFAKKK